MMLIDRAQPIGVAVALGLVADSHLDAPALAMAGLVVEIKCTAVLQQ